MDERAYQMNAGVSSFHYNSCHRGYFYTGYIIKAHRVDNSVFHLALVDRKTRYSHAVQSAYVTSGDGIMFGTMKHTKVAPRITHEFWELFKSIIKRHTKAKILVGEVPAHLAEHYMKEYSGLTLSKRQPHTPLPNITVLEAVL